MQIIEWCNAFGLAHNPFEALDEGRCPDERSQIDHPALYRILDDCSGQPRHHMVCAARGAGKTVLCSQFARQYRATSALVVELTDWPALLDRAAAESAPPLRELLVGTIVTAVAQALSVSPPETRAAPHQQLRELLALASRLGSHCFVLVDGVDGARETPDAAFAAGCVQPLIAETRLLQIANLSFKYFLPPEVIARLTYRHDLFHHTDLSWSEPQLRALIDQRLDACLLSRGSPIKLWSLAATELGDLEKVIIHRAEPKTPREVIRLCNTLLEIVIADISEREALDPAAEVDRTIQPHHIERLLAELLARRERERATVVGARGYYRERLLDPEEFFELTELLTNVVYTCAHRNATLLMDHLPLQVVVTIRLRGPLIDDVRSILDACDRRSIEDSGMNDHPLEIVLKTASHLAAGWKLKHQVDDYLERVAGRVRPASP